MIPIAPNWIARSCAPRHVCLCQRVVTRARQWVAHHDQHRALLQRLAAQTNALRTFVHPGACDPARLTTLNRCCRAGTAPGRSSPAGGAAGRIGRPGIVGAGALIPIVVIVVGSLVDAHDGPDRIRQPNIERATPDRQSASAPAGVRRAAIIDRESDRAADVDAVPSGSGRRRS